MQNNGISTEIYSLINNKEVRPTANLIISTCSAYDYLNHSNPNLEKLTTQYYETFSITDRFTGYFSNITIGDFYDTLSADYYDSTAILGGLNATARKNQEKRLQKPLFQRTKSSTTCHLRSNQTQQLLSLESLEVGSQQSLI